jgi:hypothetical protein
VRARDPGLAGDSLVGAVAEAAGINTSMVRVAVRYYTAYPAEIDDWITANREAAVVAPRWHGSASIRGGERRLDGMSAEPVREDSSDPEVILRDLPERERGEFLRQYHEAVDAEHDPAGFRRLRHLLHTWRLIVIATSQAGYYEELEAVREGVALTTPAEEAIPGWQERLAAARAQHR